VLINSTMVKKL